jgi:hypothetical protein
MIGGITRTLNERKIPTRRGPLACVVSRQCSRACVEARSASQSVFKSGKYRMTYGRADNSITSLSAIARIPRRVFLRQQRPVDMRLSPGGSSEG